jgi:hypothetical protein
LRQQVKRIYLVANLYGLTKKIYQNMYWTATNVQRYVKGLIKIYQMLIKYVFFLTLTFRSVTLTQTNVLELSSVSFIL